MKKIIVVLAIVLLAGCRSIESPLDQRDRLKVKSEDTEKATETEKLVSEKEKLAEDKSSEERDKLKEGKAPEGKRRFRGGNPGKKERERS